jgi:hypothetical protein
MRLFQRTLLTLTAGLLCLSLTSFAEAGDWSTGTFVYEIKRGDKPIGAYIVAVQESGGSFTVEIDEWIRDTSYCHRTRQEEVWKNRRLRSFQCLFAGQCGALARIFRPEVCKWMKGGPSHQVTAALKGDLLHISGPSGTMEAPSSVIPFNPFNPHLRDTEEKIEILVTPDGEIQEAWVSFIGEEQIELGDGTVKKSFRYRYRDEKWFKDLWYDERGLWLRMQTTDDVTFTLMPGADPADYAPPAGADERCLTLPR